MKYQSKPLFKTAMIVAKKACEDKLLQIYFVGLRILQEAINPPVKGKDVTLADLNRALKPFITLLINKISELNYKARDLSLNALTALFKTKGPDFNMLIIALLDFPENSQIEKVAWRILVARIEIVKSLITNNGYNKDQWNWMEVCDKLVFPCVAHPSPDVRYAAVELVANMYKIIGEEVKTEASKIQLKPKTKEMLMEKLQPKQAEPKVPKS